MAERHRHRIGALQREDATFMTPATQKTHDPAGPIGPQSNTPRTGVFLEGFKRFLLKFPGVPLLKMRQKFNLSIFLVALLLKKNEIIVF